MLGSTQRQARFQPNSVGVDGPARRTVDSSGRRTGARASVRGLGTVEQVEQVESESAMVGEGGTVDSLGRRTGARDGGVGGVGRARVRRGVRRRVGLAGVCRTR